MRDIQPEYWSLRNRASQRALGICEYCDWRRGTELHHRWYDEAYYTGLEPLESVMWVCRACHTAIHGLGPGNSRLVRIDSLAAGGDTGTGRPDRWLAYLEAREPFREKWYLDDGSDPRRKIGTEVWWRRTTNALAAWDERLRS